MMEKVPFRCSGVQYTHDLFLKHSVMQSSYQALFPACPWDESRLSDRLIRIVRTSSVTFEVAFLLSVGIFSIWKDKTLGWKGRHLPFREGW